MSASRVSRSRVYAGQATTTERLTAAQLSSAKNLVLTPGGAAAMALAYFTPGGPQALAVGDSITFQASVHLDVLLNATDGIRFGLFDSGGVRAAADSEGGTNSATYDAYRGYSVWLNPGASGGFNLYRRGGAGQNPFSAVASTLMGANNIADLALTTSPVMIPRFSMTITRLTSGIQIEAAINGRSVVRTEPAIVTPPVTQTSVVGSGVSLSVSAQSAGPNSGLSYQWQRNGTDDRSVKSA